MRVVLFILFFCSLPLLVKSQNLQGRIISSVDSLAIEGTHIVNVSQNRMAISDKDGRFSLLAKAGDSLVVSNVNYNTKQFLVKQSDVVTILMSPASIQLDEVRVSNLPETAADFRKKIISMDGIEENSIKIDGLMPVKPKGKVPKNYDPNYTNSLGYALNKPISFIVKKFSKDHKNKLKYYQTVANQSNKISNSKKYNPEIVKELTGLEGDELTDFVEFLDFDPAFISRSTEYEIAVRILKEFDYYKSQSRKG